MCHGSKKASLSRLRIMSPSVAKGTLISLNYATARNQTVESTHALPVTSQAVLSLLSTSLSKVSRY